MKDYRPLLRKYRAKGMTLGNLLGDNPDTPTFAEQLRAPDLDSDFVEYGGKGQGPVADRGSPVTFDEDESTTYVSDRGLLSPEEYLGWLEIESRREEERNAQPSPATNASPAQRDIMAGIQNMVSGVGSDLAGPGVDDTALLTEYSSYPSSGKYLPPPQEATALDTDIDTTYGAPPAYPSPASYTYPWDEEEEMLLGRKGPEAEFVDMRTRKRRGR